MNAVEIEQAISDLALQPFDAAVADPYCPEAMPATLKRAHEHNEKVLERFYTDRSFKTDTERMVKLFERYTKMTAAEAKAMPARKAARRVKA